MRSVLDMRLGTLSAPVDVAAAFDAIDLGRTSMTTPSCDCVAANDGSDGDGERENDAILAVELLRTLNVDAPRGGSGCGGVAVDGRGDFDGRECGNGEFGRDVRRQLCWRHDGDDDVFGDAQRHDRGVDLFGIPIPNVNDKDGAGAGCEAQAVSSASVAMDGACSVLLAESPSRLDLSALLC